jgi:ribonuclease Z
MVKLIFLGTANAIPDQSHENTHLAIVGEQRFLLIDCANNPIVRLSQASLDVQKITDLILTHFHPDHVSGVPSLLMSSWLLGRRDPLRIYGLSGTLERTEKMMEFYDWATWPNFYPVEFHPIPEVELAPVFDCPEFRLFTSPVCHMVPNIGLRIEFLQSGKAVAYSCDTAPCEAVTRLAREADILIHEATGDTFGHTSARQAGEIAAQARAKQLFLIHYSTRDFNPASLVNEARQTFPGPVVLATDLMELSF